MCVHSTLHDFAVAPSRHRFESVVHLATLHEVLMSDRKEAGSTGQSEQSPNPAEQKYDSPIKPLLWILLPLIAVLLYGMLSN